MYMYAPVNCTDHMHACTPASPLSPLSTIIWQSKDAPNACMDPASPSPPPPPPLPLLPPTITIVKGLAIDSFGDYKPLHCYYKIHVVDDTMHQMYIPPPKIAKQCCCTLLLLAHYMYKIMHTKLFCDHNNPHDRHSLTSHICGWLLCTW